MRINRTQKKYKIIIVLAVIASVAGIFVFAWFSPLVPFFGVKADAPENTVDYKAPSDEQKSAGERAKEAFVKDKYSDDTSTGDGQSSASKIGVNFTSVSQADSFLQLRVTVSLSEARGECLLILSKSGRDDITNRSGVQSMGSFSVCQGFDIAQSELSAGEWLAVVKYVQDGSVLGEDSRKVQVTQ